MFKPLSRTSGDHPAFEYPGLMVANEAAALGELLKYNSTYGTLTKASGTDVPDYVCMGAVAAAASPTIYPPCIRVDEMQEFQTTVGTGTDPIVVGTKLTVHTDGLTVTTTTTSGIFQTSSTTKAYNAAAATGDVITGYFRR